MTGSLDVDLVGGPLDGRTCESVSPLGTRCGLPRGHRGLHVADVPHTHMGAISWPRVSTEYPASEAPA
jgi:hypothetical protein